MALYRPDYKLIEAKKAIEKLEFSAENELIKYYISKKDAEIERLNKEAMEYRNFFTKLSKFMPRNGRDTVYG